MGFAPGTDAVVDVAEATLALCERRPSAERLHHLLYVVQAGCLAWYGRPAFVQEIRAGEFGPFVSGLSRWLLADPDGGVVVARGDRYRIDVGVRLACLTVVGSFSDIGDEQLADYVMAAGTPWRRTREASAAVAPVIAPETMREYHARRGVTPRAATHSADPLARFLDSGDESALSAFLRAVFDDAGRCSLLPPPAAAQPVPAPAGDTGDALEPPLDDIVLAAVRRVLDPSESELTCWLSDGSEPRLRALGRLVALLAERMTAREVATSFREAPVALVGNVTWDVAFTVLPTDDLVAAVARTARWTPIRH